MDPSPVTPPDSDQARADLLNSNLERKPKSTSKLWAPGVPEFLDDCLFTQNFSLERTVALLAEKFGIESSKTRLHEWRKERSQQLSLERIQRNNSVCESINVALRANADQIDESLFRMVSQLAFEISTSHNPDPAKLKMLVDCVLRLKSLSNDSEKIALLKQKAAQTDQCKEVAASALTPEQKQARYREILGLA